MPGELPSRIERLKHKAEVLFSRYQMLKEQKVLADEEISQLKATLAERDRQIENLNRDLDYMKAAVGVAPSKEELEKSRALLTHLVRDINKCINDLKQ
ncbi:MAG: hypothetical protein K2F80_02140 [Muribaculaceae bacterium]|nr:hypothetical protein [Muribaculaceae bacterium]